MEILRVAAYGLAALLKQLARLQVGFADMLSTGAEHLEKWADDRRRGS